MLNSKATGIDAVKATLIKFIKSRLLVIFFLSLIGLSLTLTCAPTRHELSKKDFQVLQLQWVKSYQYSTRIEIVKELERRKDIDNLLSLLASATVMYGRYNSNIQAKDCIFIIKALGRLKDPRASSSIIKAARLFQNKKIRQACLKVYLEIVGPEVTFPVKDYLGDPDPEIRWIALHTLGYMKDPDSIETIFPLLYDKDPDIRWKAITVLGEIGNPKAINNISLLLSDREESVKNRAEVVLRELGVSEEKIRDWKGKAKQLSLEDVYHTKIAYQKAVMEKDALKIKLESEADVKRQLEESLKERELAYNKQQKFIASLYEKERQLKSKVFQLEQAQRKSEENRKKLEELNNRAEEINKELRQIKSDKTTASIKKELNRILQAKSKAEADAKNLKAKELTLRDEVSALKARSKEASIEAENAKEELATMRTREQNLAGQIDELKNRLKRGMAPVLVVSKPKNGSKIESSTTMLHVIAVDDRGISKINASLNENPVRIDTKRGIKVSSINKGKISKQIDITERLQLEYGQNTIKVSVTDTDGMSTEEMITVIREKEHGKIWAIVIGINEYQNTRNLRYAVNDARGFESYLKEYIGIPDEHIFFLTDQGATQAEIKSLLGTKIKRKAGKDDTVIIFYAGHGAVETDPLDPDGDGFEKYLLPYDARLDDLYSTAIAMKEVKTIFQRINAERLIFIADTCYSGASGGRTTLASKTRATLSEKFFERISKGKGRVIISACSANEISKEDDTLKHGVFSYYLLKGLKGAGDFDGDGIITVGELFSFLSSRVPEASGQDQHPVRKGETEGELVIGRIK